MQVPIRKPGKYTHQRPDPHITVAKLEEFKQDLARLKASQQPAAKEVMRLAEMGDFSENAAYQMAKGRLRGINQKITELEHYLNHAVVIAPADDAELIQLGHRVTVAIAGTEKTFLILGSEEADPDQGVISQHSPIGSALMGRRVGATVTIRLKDREVSCKILSVE